MAGGRVLLVVDDEPLVREMMVDVFEDEGYLVLEAGTGEDGLLLLSSREDICAIITDVEMPGHIDGLAFANLARTMRPELGIVVVSGRARPTLQALATEARFIPKPFSVDRLTSVVRDLVFRSA